MVRGRNLIYLINSAQKYTITLEVATNLIFLVYCLKIVAQCVVKEHPCTQTAQCIKGYKPKLTANSLFTVKIIYDTESVMVIKYTHTHVMMCIYHNILHCNKESSERF